ncbi:MAG: AAA family ATPase [Prevotellaceae bacterium]|jgi:MinD-like ATPase involved in chromosome partitioning or flagellar assembly/Tfp pilus assembly protein PilF|nr:AAA family ATPase [Prevotellaceae bacterium]
MKTITFYSYKGGVGRTLALVNIANRLAEFGKKVCVMDFDLEAPGLIHKYKQNIGEVQQGLVDYIYEFAVEKKLPGSIGEYANEITKYNYSGKNLKKRENNIIFIPAGNSDSSDYWKKLSRISWWDMFFKEDSEGIPFFLDLKEKIQKEFKPDYLLIDNRTGITDTSSLTMSLLADSIVLLAVNNEENICGTQHIIKAFTNEANNLLDIDREIHFVLTRLPQITSPEEWVWDEAITNRIKQRIEEAFQDSNKKLNSFNVIHSNNDIALYDRVNIGYDFDKKDEKQELTPSISSEYLSLFDSLTEKDLSKEEKGKFDNLKRGEVLLQRAWNSYYRNDPSLLTQVDEIKKIIPQLPDIYLLQGYCACDIKDYTNAIKLFNKAIELGDISGYALYYRAEAYMFQKKFQEALDDYSEYLSKGYKEFRPDVLVRIMLIKEQLGVERMQLISECKELIKKYPDNSTFYNFISYLYRNEKEYDLALKNIYKAIELDTGNGHNYKILAEINFCMNDKLTFYRNFDEALNRGFNIESILTNAEDTKNIYKQAINDPEFIRILKKYNKVYFIELLQKDTE